MTRVKLKRIKPTIAFAGSLIQQNHSEDLTGHGLIEWNLSDLSYKEINIANDYGFYTLEIENGQITNWDDKIPNKPRLRVRFKNTTLEERKQIEAIVRAKRSVAEWTVQVLDKTAGKSPDTVSITNIRDLEYQKQLLEEYYPGHVLLPKIFEINKDVNTRVDDGDASRNVIWKPIKFEFSNMFSYGEDNVVDFQNMGGIYGIFAKNASGKTNFFESICFCLFDKCSKSNQAKDVLNREKDYFTCKLEFESSGQRYVIEKKGKKDNAGHVKVDIDFYTFDTHENKVSLNGDQRASTNKIIRNYVGTYDDFVLTALSAQSGENFIEKSQKERRDLLAQFIDINIFEEFYKVAYEDFKETKVLVDNLQKEDFTEKMAQAHREKSDYEKTLLVLEGDLKEKEAYHEKVQNVKEALIGTLERIEEYPTEEQVQGDINVLTETIRTQAHSINLLQLDTTLEEYQVRLEEKIKTLASEESLFGKVNVLEDLEKAKITYDKELLLLKSSIKRYEEDITLMCQHEYDPNCGYCVKHPVVKRGEEAKESLEKLNTELDQKTVLLSKLIDEINEISECRSQLSDIMVTKSTMNGVLRKLHLKEQRIQGCLNEINETQGMLQEKQQLLEKTQNVVEIQKSNRETQAKIEKCNDVLRGTKTEITFITKDITEYTGKIKLQNFIIEESKTKIAQLKELGEKFEAYKMYLQAVKSSGIPYRIIEKVLPEIQRKVNEILNQIVEFEILLESEGNANINAYITYGHEKFWTLEGGSGMEKFISSLAIRTALINNTSLPKPNFICIDEGFGVLDTENLSNVALLFDILKGQFELIICISHLESMKDIVDDRIEVNKTGTFSSINFN